MRSFVRSGFLQIEDDRTMSSILSPHPWRDNMGNDMTDTITTRNYTLASNFQPAKNDKLSHNLLRVACFICAIDLPDAPKRSVFGTYLQRSLLAIVAVLSLVLLLSTETYFLSHIAGPIQWFVNAFNQDSDKSKIPLQIGPSVIRAFLFCFWFGATVWLISIVQSRAYKFTSESLALERERAARQEVESTLRLLKAQIEPHFLFNTLGAVQQLAEGKAPEAAALTSDLIVFLRATLNSLRADSTSLAEDLSICGAYLHIMEARLTRRLKFQIDCPPEFAHCRIPTTLLLTLVENAIKHGIERAPDGGRIDITVRKADNNLCIAVADTGIGLVEPIGQGLGLQNIRDRLTLLYGERATLTLEENEPNGVVANLIFPLSLS